MDTLGDRMKRYELCSRTKLLPRSYIALRVDGKAFHTFTRNMKKPFDAELINCMVKAGEKVAREMGGFLLGYHQSDEFTFIITDTNNYESQYWFDGEVQKLCSVTASMFGAYFNKYMFGTEAIFDCRAFNVPEEDVPNIFIWRQRDWERNSLQMFARSFYSHKEMEGKKHDDIHEMLYKIGENWANLSNTYKNGTFITKDGERICEKMTYGDIVKVIHKLKLANDNLL